MNEKRNRFPDNRSIEVSLNKPTRKIFSIPRTLSFTNEINTIAIVDVVSKLLACWARIKYNENDCVWLGSFIWHEKSLPSNRLSQPLSYYETNGDSCVKCFKSILTRGNMFGNHVTSQRHSNSTISHTHTLSVFSEFHSPHEQKQFVPSLPLACHARLKMMAVTVMMVLW